MIRRIRLQRLAPQDREAWQKHYYGHQKHWRRRRLLALKAIWDGQSLAEVCRQQKVRRQTLTHWLDGYLHGGFDALLARAPVHRTQLLSEQRQRILRYILLHKTPAALAWTATNGRRGMSAPSPCKSGTSKRVARACTNCSTNGACRYKKPTATMAPPTPRNRPTDRRLKKKRRSPVKTAP